MKTLIECDTDVGWCELFPGPCEECVVFQALCQVKAAYDLEVCRTCSQSVPCWECPACEGCVHTPLRDCRDSCIVYRPGGVAAAVSWCSAKSRNNSVSCMVQGGN